MAGSQNIEEGGQVLLFADETKCVRGVRGVCGVRARAIANPRACAMTIISIRI